MKITEWLAKTLVILFVLVGVLTISCLLFYRFGVFSLEALTLVVSVCDVLSSIVAGAFIVVQLRSDNDADIKRAKTEEARFILEYNMEFLKNKELCEVEHYLEDAITHQGKGEIKSLQEERQKLVNYLVYLEGFASCVQQGILDIRDIDNLFSYRFFLAMNHPEVQKLEILPFADFYRGNYQLYEDWYRYRMKNREKDYIDDIDNCADVMPLANSALFKNCNYEMYIEDSIRVSLKAPVDEQEEYIACFKYNGCGYEYSKNTGIKATDELGNRDRVPPIMRDEELIRRAMFCIEKNERKKEEIDLKGIQITQDCNIPDIQYKEIAELIYYTDPYIYPALFGEGEEGIENARRLIPELIVSNRDSMFNKNNIYIYKSKNHVIGLILWHRGQLIWDTECFLDKATKLGINLNMGNVKMVKEQYIASRYEDSISETIELINVCISKEFRGLGVGKMMLRDFIREHRTDRMQLCVLSDNGPAIQLYKSFGFVCKGRSKGFSLNEHKPLCDDMVKV